MPVDLDEVTIDLGLARDQGPRPTCLSFSLSEIHRAALELDELLSPESLHRKSAARAKKPPSMGLALCEATEALREDGQTTEAAWPYNSDKQLPADSGFYRAIAANTPFDRDIVLDIIRIGRPVSLILDVDLSFFRLRTH